MSLQLGGMIGGVTQVATAVQGEKNLKSFLASVNKLGVQVTNNFEVNFSGIDAVSFYVQSITIPGLELAHADVKYNGRKVEIPVNYDWNHDFSMNVINDAQGYLYTAITNFLIAEANSEKVNSGYTLTVKALTGDEKYKGTLYTFFGVRITSLGSLSYAYDQNNTSMFDLQLKCNYFNVTPGALGTAANVIGAFNSLIG